MRNNLLFHGIPEEEGENCEDVVRLFIKDKMKISTDVQFDRVHRIGPKRSDLQSGTKDITTPRPRSIVGRFILFKEREIVRKQAPKTLKGTPFSVYEQFPQEVEERRRLLYPIMRKARAKKAHVRLVRDRLFVDHEEVHPTMVKQPDGNEDPRRGYKRRRVPSTPNH